MLTKKQETNTSESRKVAGEPEIITMKALAKTTVTRSTTAVLGIAALVVAPAPAPALVPALLPDPALAPALAPAPAPVAAPTLAQALSPNPTKRPARSSMKKDIRLIRRRTTKHNQAKPRSQVFYAFSTTPTDGHRPLLFSLLN